MPDKEIPVEPYDQDEPVLQPGPNWSDADRWLPKTDWSRDGIIASDD